MIRPIMPWQMLAQTGMQYELAPAGVFVYRHRAATDSANVFDGCHHGRLSCLTLHDPPPMLVELAREVDYASPKQVVFFDSSPLLGKASDRAINWVDSTPPDLIAIFLNPFKATPEVVAHELGHVHLELFEKLEDERVYIHPYDQPTTFLVNCIQSLVLDCPVLEFLKGRGFDTARFRLDLMAAAYALVEVLEQGRIHGTLEAEVHAAGFLAVATAFPDLYELDAEDRALIDTLWTSCRRHAPPIFGCASDMLAVLRANGFRPLEGALRSIDGCLVAAFRLIGRPFHPVTHLVWREPRTEWLDKMPGFLPGMPPHVKHGILRKAIAARSHVKRALPRQSDVCVEFWPPDRTFTTSPFPAIRRPLPWPPSKYSRDPNTLFAPGSQAEERFVAAQLAMTGNPGLAIHLSADFNIYGNKFRFKDTEGKNETLHAGVGNLPVQGYPSLQE